jgi:hypothetical protein
MNGDVNWFEHVTVSAQSAAAADDRNDKAIKLSSALGMTARIAIIHFYAFSYVATANGV